MVWPFQSQHALNVQFKRKERTERINALKEYHQPLTSKEQDIFSRHVQEVVKQVKAGEVTPREVLKAYGKRALIVQDKTNALTEIMIKEAETWANEVNLDGPLAGIPISLKDPFIVGGFDSTAAYSARTRIPLKEDGTLVKLLREAGAYPYVKTSVPITMMAIEGYNDVWGRTRNPHNPAHSAGGSSTGEGALIGGGGSRIGVGTDSGGSVRVPPAWCGLYSLRMTAFRFPLDGDVSADSGAEGVPVVASPMTGRIEDLRYFVESIFSMKPWKYDYHLIPLPWRTDVKLPAKPRVGVLTLEDMLVLTPAQRRALTTVADALKKRGCEVVDFKLPAPAREYDENAFDLFQASGYRELVSPLLFGEHSDPFIQGVANYARLPKCIRKVWEFLLRVVGFKEYADMYARQRVLTTSEYQHAVAKREHLRRLFREAWDDQKLDFVVTAAHPSPAVHSGVKDCFRTILYTSLFNLLDYPCGAVPVSRVDSTLDMLPPAFDVSKLNYESRVYFNTYDAAEMKGLPTAVQVVGMRFQDEETLAAMEYVVDALHDIGVAYE